MSSSDGGGRECESGGNSGDEVRGFQMEQGRAVDSPLGQLDPSRITHMVVDQVGFGGSGVQPDIGRFVVPGPPHQQWIRSSPAASPSVMASPSKGMVLDFFPTVKFFVKLLLAGEAHDDIQRLMSLHEHYLSSFLK
ncbi:hypothetical protein ANCCAN_09682 [Ancylostoma caninum]|uniref:Uncharacterized protein n=1 Tax=Ancylostoma caninum TaxID=29170 RepID=A0A368GKZ0_ANCCA|nr:hypothetical protein ANCCAN_09682 [Ancylostoma caninum]